MIEICTSVDQAQQCIETFTIEFGVWFWFILWILIILYANREHIIVRIKRAVYDKGTIAYLSNDFPVEKLRGMRISVKRFIYESPTVRTLTQTDKDLCTKEFENIITCNDIYINSIHDGYDYKNISHYTLSFPHRYLTLTDPNAVVIKSKIKRKEFFKMARIHRFLLQAAIVYMVWKLVLNMEYIANYIVTLSGLSQ